MPSSRPFMPPCGASSPSSRRRSFCTFIDWRVIPQSLQPLKSSADPIQSHRLGQDKRRHGQPLRSSRAPAAVKKGKAPHINNVELASTVAGARTLDLSGASSMGPEARKWSQHHPTVKPVAMLEDALLDMANAATSHSTHSSGRDRPSSLPKGRPTLRGASSDPLYVDLICVVTKQRQDGKTVSRRHRGDICRTGATSAEGCRKSTVLQSAPRTPPSYNLVPPDSS